MMPGVNIMGFILMVFFLGLTAIPLGSATVALVGLVFGLIGTLFCALDFALYDSKLGTFVVSILWCVYFGFIAFLFFDEAIHSAEARHITLLVFGYSCSVFGIVNFARLFFIFRKSA